MPFYDLSLGEREKLLACINHDISLDLTINRFLKILEYFQDGDTYIRKAAYQAFGKIYFKNEGLKPYMLQLLDSFILNSDFKVRQSAINAAGEIGKRDFKSVQHLFDSALFDEHHSPRNAVIGSIKKMVEINPKPVLAWAKFYLHHSDKEIRREICHGIELRGRKYPQEILPLLKELQFDSTARVRNTLIHVIGQISYKKGCLEVVIQELKYWENTQLVSAAIDEIIEVHARYKNFAFFSQAEAKEYIDQNM